MTKESTLITLAMLKVTIDQGDDYLAYIKPFVLYILNKSKPEIINDVTISDLVKNNFGIQIPPRTIQIILGRLVKEGILTKSSRKYSITGKIDEVPIETEKAKSERIINSLLNNFIEFCSKLGHTLSRDDAIDAFILFLSEFSISYIESYLKTNTLPDIQNKNNGKLYLASKYITYKYKTDPKSLDGMFILAQGYMLSNALLCPDLQSAPKTFSQVTFYFDTPLIIRLTGLEGDYPKQSVETLIELLRQQNGKVACFSHTQEEVTNVIDAASNHIDSPQGRGRIIDECRRQNKTKSDLLLISNSIEEILRKYKMSTEETPAHIKKFQIDEKSFDYILDEKIYYRTESAKLYDIKSLRSIYVLRKGTNPRALENSKAILVTSNQALAGAAFQYRKQFNESTNFSTIITDFSLSNIAWLKSPVKTPDMPKVEILATAYAALCPKPSFWLKVLDEANKLLANKNINERDIQILRLNQTAKELVMDMTLGDDNLLSQQSIHDVIENITSEIKSEESSKLIHEKKNHDETRNKLISTTNKLEKIRHETITKAKIYATIDTILIAIGFGLILFFSLLYTTKELFSKDISFVDISITSKYSYAIVSVVSIIILVTGGSLFSLHKRIYTHLNNKYQTNALKRLP